MSYFVIEDQTFSRKIVQIEIVTTAHGFFGSAYRIYALCDDGSLWYRDATHKADSRWHPVRDLITQQEDISSCE